VIADGAMWVEADTNVSGGESLIRQVMYGRQYFPG
jgi:alpha-mannosidase